MIGWFNWASLKLQRKQHKIMLDITNIYITLCTTHRTDTKFHTTQPIRLKVHIIGIAIMKRVTTIYTT